MVVWMLSAGVFAARAQRPASAPGPAPDPPKPAAPTLADQPASASVASIAGGRLHGLVKSGNIPLPGVTVTAANTLTGKRYTTTTDVTGAWSMTIPQNGRYVIRTQFAAFAQGSQEAVLNASSRDQTVNIDLILASRAAQQEQLESQQAAQAANVIRQIAGNGLQSLNLLNSLSEGGETQAAGAGSSAAGASLPSAAGNSDFSGESVAISGQQGSVSPLAGVDVDRIRDAIETFRAQNPGLDGRQGNFILNGGPGGGAFLGGGGGFGGPGGFGGGFGGGPGGGRMNFRNFKPGQPHGAIFWTGSNSSLNAEPFALRGQDQQQPASGTNRFGLTYIGAPYLPGLTKPGSKDTVFLTLAGQRNSTPSDLYATVPTEGEREGNIPGVETKITPIPAAASLLKYFPLPNLPGDQQNYHLLTTAQSNATQAGVRYMRGIGANATPFGMFGGRGGGGGQRSQKTQGLRQSINFNYNWSHLASDTVNIFPSLGGRQFTDSNSVQAGYTLGYRKLTSIFNASWNRNDRHATNFFTNGVDIATENGVLGPDGTALNSSPLNYGLPNITLAQFTGLNEQQPSLLLQQTVSLSETMSWIHNKHNLRFGGDYRRVHRDLLGSSNATGSFYFTGFYTGSSLGDFLEGKPQETSIDSAVSKSYLRDNVFDAFAQDDWRVLPSLTLLYGLRYEFYAPYTEKDNHLAFVDTNPSGLFTRTAQVQAGGTSSFSGRLPDSLVFPFRTALAPRLGLALRLPKQTVVRAGFGMNYTVGQYATFATAMAHEPPFSNEQTNEATTQCPSPTTDCLSLANGFPKPAAIGNYAVNPHYQLPYVEVWNVDVQKTLPLGIVMNAGYNGSKGNHLDITSAPRATPSSPNTDPGDLIFNYEQSVAFSKLSAGTLRVNKRLSNGIALGANYEYSHSIDNAGSVGGTSTVVAQNWQDLGAEQGNSSFDQRHKVSGNYLFELPFGQDKHWLTSGSASHIFEGFSVSGSFTFATGASLTPVYQAAALDVARGTAGSLRPDVVPGASLTAGGGTVKRWFNTAAFTALAPGQLYGTAWRNSIPGPGTIQNSMSLAKTLQLGETRSMEIRATASNVFNTVQYSTVDTNVVSPTFGQVTGTGAMRDFSFMARFRF